MIPFLPRIPKHIEKTPADTSFLISRFARDHVVPPFRNGDEGGSGVQGFIVVPSYRDAPDGRSEWTIFA
jgi:hypothetical protein